MEQFTPVLYETKTLIRFNVVLNDYVVNLLLYLYVFVACNCSSLLYLYVVVFRCCFCFLLLFFSSFLVAVYCMFMLGTAEKQFFEWM